MGLSRNNNEPNDSLYTPTWIFEALNVQFDLDPAHPNHKTNVPANDYYTKENDGLILAWYGFVWLNPPFRGSGIWADKFIAHNNGIMLVQMSKSRWFWNVWDKAEALLVIPNNLKFEKTDKTTQTIFMPTCLVGMGDKAIQTLIKSGIGKVR